MSGPASRTRHGIFILLRRLRAPLVVLIFVYAVAVLGFTLVPGVDPNGHPWRMSFFHAFYFVSFLGSTIGLGEIPYPFSDAQRLWATVAIYGTVLSWLYAIGALFNVLQDPLFRRILHESSVERAVRRLRDPFYLICGYDDAGALVARELGEDGTHMVVVDVNPARIENVEVDELHVPVPALRGDASDPQVLTAAGLRHPDCAGVLALTGNDRVNLKIALTARLLNKDLPVICAARAHVVQASMADAGAEHIINPFDTFADRLAMSIRAPSLHVIYESLTTQRGTAMTAPVTLPRGRWILCGSGPFSRALRRHLTRLQIETTVVDTKLDDTCTEDGGVCGEPIDDEVLKRAGIEQADAIVAGTDVDADNLVIALHARSLNKALFIAARQTQRRNTSVFRAAPADLIMLTGYVIAAEVLRIIRAPQLSYFLRLARTQDEAWAAALLDRMRHTIGEAQVESWSVAIDGASAPGVCAALRSGRSVRLRHLMAVAQGNERLVRAVPLLRRGAQEKELLPALDAAVREGDQILFCGRAHARDIMRSALGSTRMPNLPAAGGDEAATPDLPPPTASPT